MIHDLSQNPELRSFLTDASVPYAEKVADNIQSIIGWQDLARNAGSYACLLSGGHDPSSSAPEGQGHIDTKEILTNMGLYERYLFVRKDGRTLRNMTGYNRLIRSEWQTRKGGSPGGHAFDKFYLSLDLTSEQRIEQGGKFFREIVAGAQDQGALLSTKDFTHAYDALLLYTYRPHSAMIAKVLQELYPKYRDAGLFYDTQHFFQGEINNVAPEHIGFVQEPSYNSARSKTLGSHSQRMGRLGGYIDTLGPNLETALTPEVCIAAAALGTVEPAYPYLVSESRAYYSGN